VRELRNVIERAVILSPGGEISPESLLFHGGPNGPEADAECASENLSVAEMERRLIGRVLANTAWRKGQAAQILGINRTTLYNKIREYSLAPGVG
jgi:DNA-binding NtrC family response regulator